MKYFKLRGNSDPKIIGVNNGVHQGEIKWRKFANNKAQKIIMEYFSLEKYRKNIEEIESFNFEIQYVEAYRSAKLTDFFRFTPRLWGIEFFVTNEVKELFSQFNLPMHAYIPVNIYHKQKLYNYSALYIPYSYRLDSIDFENSIFFKGNEILGKKYFKFKDEEDWSKNKISQAEKLFFNENFDKSLDLFISSFGGGGYYVSERLKKAIEEHSLTGVRLLEPKDPEIYF